MTDLLEFASHEFRLNKLGKDGKSLRETCQVAERMTGRPSEEGINPVDFPDVLFDLWRWFTDLSSARQQGLGPAPITYTDMQAYFSLMGLRPAAWQVEAIHRLDNVALASLKDTNGS